MKPLVVLFAVLFAVLPLTAARPLRGQVSQGVAQSRFVERLSRETNLKLAIGLPLRNQEKLDAFLEAITDPASPAFHHYLSSEEFTERFGPSEADYRAVTEYAEAHGLTVTETHPNRMILDVSGSAASVERAFHVTLQTRWHATRGTFYTPDSEPSVDAEVPILDVSGLDNFVLPRPMDLKTLPLTAETAPLVTGSGPRGLFIGKDFRAAYAPNVVLTGAGQTVGLFELDGFYTADVAANFKQAGLPPVPVQTVLVNGFSGAPGKANIEVMLDIMMAAYMAPESKVIVYEGASWNDVLNRMATDNTAKQLSSSWGFSPINATTEQIFKQFIAQGQSLLQSSGDSGAYRGWIFTPCDNPNLTVVGGTSLSTSGVSGPWQSEAAWSGSGGGSSTVYPMPTYQQGVNMAAAGGSNTMRNIPDVALTADVQLFLIQNNGQPVSVGGTSAAAPLWAGFTALVNQQAAAISKPPVGFLNPLLYSLGKGSNYTQDFHDIVSGGNGFSASPGYDLATGWGTPAGQHLIDDLTGLAGAPSFTISATPAVLTLKQGSSASVSIALSPQNGFKSSVTYSVSGLPAGVTAVASSGTVTFTSSASAAAGRSAIGISATSGQLKSTTSVMLNVTVPDFSLSLSSSAITLLPGTSAELTVTAVPLEGFTGAVNLSVTGLPPGVTATVVGTTVRFTPSASAANGSSTATIAAKAGSLTHSASLAVAVVVPSANTALVNLSAIANVNAIVSDGSTFAGGGIDTKGAAYSANLLGPSQLFNGTAMYFGPPNTLNGVSGKTIAVPAGSYSALKFLATATNGNLPSQNFVATYSDGTTTSYTQSISDWFTPQNYPGETRVTAMPYRDNSNGTRDTRPFSQFGYVITLNSAKKLTSFTLPDNRNVIVTAVSLLTAPAGPPAPVSVNLAPVFDTIGISTNGAPFIGGLDGAGHAYSANLLEASRTLEGVTFTFGAAGGPDAISGNGKTVPLPAGTFGSLAMLGCAINGAQAAQTFKVIYTDGTSSVLNQKMSDWSRPQNLLGETVAATMQRRNTSKGAADNIPAFLYRYVFSINSTKTVAGLVLPLNKNVRVLAVTLRP